MEIEDPLAPLRDQLNAAVAVVPTDGVRTLGDSMLDEWVALGLVQVLAHRNGWVIARMKNMGANRVFLHNVKWGRTTWMLLFVKDFMSHVRDLRVSAEGFQPVTITMAGRTSTVHPRELSEVFDDAVVPWLRGLTVSAFDGLDMRDQLDLHNWFTKHGIEEPV